MTSYMYSAVKTFRAMKATPCSVDVRQLATSMEGARRPVPTGRTRVMRLCVASRNQVWTCRHAAGFTPVPEPKQLVPPASPSAECVASITKTIRNAKPELHTVSSAANPRQDPPFPDSSKFNNKFYRNYII